MLPDVAVAAKERRPVPSPRSGIREPTASGAGAWLPVGIRHGVLCRPDERVTTRQALCGASLSGWLVFAATEFDGSAPGDCQRCAQVRRGLPGRQPGRLSHAGD